MTDRFTPVQRFHLAQLWEQHHSVVAVQREYAQMFNLRRHDPRPQRKTILEAYDTAITVGLAHKPRGGSLRSVRTADNVQRVVDAVVQHPQTSQRRLSAQLDLSLTSINRILRDRGFHPYRLRHRHALNEEDFESRVDFASDFLSELEDSPDMLQRIISDEAIFHVNGRVNGWNCRFYAQENPDFVADEPLNSPKVVVWCGVSWKRIFGPFFFKDDHGVATTVDGERYRSMIGHFLLPELQGDEDFLEDRLFFQQDGATAHTARDTIRLLEENFPGKVISRRGDIQWPARSPDLTPLDFWLWGALKHRVYSTAIRSVVHLEQCIREEIETISVEERQSAILAFKGRLNKVISTGGGHIE